MSQNKQISSKKILFSTSSWLIATDEPPYRTFEFEVPSGVSKVGVRLSFNSPTIAQIPMALYDPDGIRGIVVNEPIDGEINDELWISTRDSSKGGLAGAIHEGQWRILLFMRRLQQDVEFSLEAYVEFGKTETPLPQPTSEPTILKSSSGWYKGELHSHSDHSTGRTSFGEVVQAAMTCEYDFLAVTDHLTVSHWGEIPNYADNGKTILIRSAEIAGNYGHANVHDLSNPIDPFVDGTDWRMNQIADAVHQQGGLFCVNHPMSGKTGWRYDDFDWNKADLYEIYCIPEGPNNNFNPIAWDHHLLAGQKLVGIGSSDSHDPYSEPLWKFGQVMNWVHADELSEKGIIEGLRRGRVYISKGPEIRFTAKNEQGESAEMWESLPLNEATITFSIKIRNSPQAHLVVIKNGYPFDDFVVEESNENWETITFQDTPSKQSYYRIEVHRYVKSDVYSFITWRDYETMLVLSNPIWVGRKL